MAMDGRHKYVECSSSGSRNCIDTVERHSIGMRVHKAKKFFSLRGKTANSGQCGQKIDNRTYSDLVYDVLHRPQRDIDNQNSHSCDDRHGADWRQSATMKWSKNAIAHSEGMGDPGLFDQLGWGGNGR
jgi:hypothetical protein